MVSESIRWTATVDGVHRLASGAFEMFVELRATALRCPGFVGPIGRLSQSRINAWAGLTECLWATPPIEAGAIVGLFPRPSEPLAPSGSFIASEVALARCQ